ncbi:MAG: hypothetical protein ACYC6Z_10175 [Thermoleophilia bacterium]
MSKQRKIIVKRATFIFVPLILIAMLGASLALGSRANGLPLTDWQKVQQYVDAYIQRQFSANGEGEGSVAASQSTPDGFYVNQATLKSELDSNNDSTMLGEGDNLANAPVLIDSLDVSVAGIIPGTSFRCNWNSAPGNNCFDAASVADIKTLVDNHQAATGTVPKLINYCLTDHTAAPVTGGLGYIAQTGAFATDASIPYVYGFAWGRDGWTNTAANAGSSTVGGIYTYAKSNPVAAAASVSSYTPPSTVPGSCTSGSGDADLVRCAAEWSIYSAGGNVGNGQIVGGSSPTQTLTAGQIVDIRTGAPANTVSVGTASTNEIPINTIFNTGLVNVNPAATNGVLIASGSQGPGGIVAEGLKMLGYATATGGYIHSGVPWWNNTLSVNQGQPNTGVSYTLDASGSNGAISAIALTDTTTPTLTGPTYSNNTGTSIDINRVASEPATSKIHLSDAAHVAPDVNANDTVLNTNKTVTVPGLTANVHYQGTLTAYDAQANPSTPMALDFWTDVTAPTISSVSPANLSTIYGTSTTVSATLGDNVGGSGINVDPAVTMVHVDSAMIMSGCTITTTSISCPTTVPLTYGSHTLEIMTADNAGNPATTSSTTFNVGDNVAPTVTYTAPTGTSNNASPTITGTVTDPAPSGGLPTTATLNLSSDGGSTWPLALQYSCTITSGAISCPVTDVLPGAPNTYNAKITVVDTATNSGSSAGTDTFTVDTTAPTVTPNGFGYLPGPTDGNWTSDTTPALSAAISGIGAGHINPATATVTIDGSACDGTVTANDTSISCTPVAVLAEGTPHTVVFSAEFNPGHPGTGTQHFNIDTSNPVISGLTPSGDIQTSTPTLHAALADYGTGSGINSASSAIYLDGSGTALTGCTRTAAAIDCPASVTAGAHTFSVYTEDNVGNSATLGTGSFTLTQINYFWTWYDNIWGDNWVLLGNGNASGDVNYSLSVHAAGQTLPGGGVVTPGNLITPKFSGLMNGPVKATSTTGTDGLLSQRILWPKGGSSLEEVPAVKESNLSDHYYWTWYDEQDPGYKDWVLVANTNASADVYYQVKVDGTVKDSGTLAAGASVTPHFSGLMGGPVEVQGWTDATMTTSAKLMASQRVLSNNGSAINEVPGTPNEKLTSHYLWTWYDQTTPGNRDWILIANPKTKADGTNNPENMYYTITINGAVAGTGGPIAPGSKVTPMFDMGIGGPVDVQTFSDANKTVPLRAIASQRVIWGPSFEEVPGYNFSDLTSDYKWTWYDMQSAGARNWVLVANTNGTPVYYEASVDGIVRASGTIAAGKNVIPAFPGIMGGPVEVKAWTDSGKGTAANVMASQRVLWNGYFNETLGQ